MTVPRNAMQVPTVGIHMLPRPEEARGCGDRPAPSTSPLGAGRPLAVTLLRAATDAITVLIDRRWPVPMRPNVADDPCPECGAVGICHSPDCGEAFHA